MSDLSLTKDERAALAGLVEQQLDSGLLDEPGHERYFFEQLLARLISAPERPRGLRRVGVALALFR